MTRRLSIKAKLVLSLALISTLLLVVMFAVSFYWYKGEQLKNVDTFLESELRWISETMATFYAEQHPRPNPNTFVQSKQYGEFMKEFMQRRVDKPLIYKTTFEILDLVDRTLIVSNGALNLDLHDLTSKGAAIYDERVLDAAGFIVSVNFSKLTYRLAYLPIQIGDTRLGAVRLGCLLDTVNQAGDLFLLSMGFFFIVAVASNVVGGLLVATRVLRPVEDMRRRVDQISEYNLNFRLEELAGKDELSSLAHTFNKTIGRIETAYRSEEALVHDISHQLRTPLTALRGGMEIALRKDRSPEEYRRVLEDGLADVDRLTTLLNTMLNLAKLEGHLAAAEKSPCNLLHLVGEIVDELGPLWEESRLGFEFRIDVLGEGEASELSFSEVSAIPEDLVARFGLMADKFRLKQALVNIFDNASRYAPVDSRIRVVASIDPLTHEIRLTIANRGQAIPAAALTKVFERFYQNNETRDSINGHGKQGFGLGLSISKSVVELHGGKIRAFNPETGGAAFEISLPI